MRTFHHHATTMSCLADFCPKSFRFYSRCCKPVFFLSGWGDRAKHICATGPKQKTNINFYADLITHSNFSLSATEYISISNLVASLLEDKQLTSSPKRRCQTHTGANDPTGFAAVMDELKLSMRMAAFADRSPSAAHSGVCWAFAKHCNTQCILNV